MTYPFDDLREFEKFRGLALQDLAAARLQLQLKLSTTSRSVVRIYYGPPGTGKTLTAVREAVRLADPSFAEKDDIAACFRRFTQLHDRLAFVTFHQSLQYEDVVESIRPAVRAPESGETADGTPAQPEPGDEARVTVQAGDATDGSGNDLTPSKGLEYILHEGPFMRMRRRAAEDSTNEFVIVVDEINRGDISRILGPLISSIEPDKRAGAEFPIGFEAQYPRTEAETRIFLPANLHIIGTMNSADRNIALVDYALRRRFDFVEVPPEPDLLPQSVSGAPPINPRRLLSVLNGRIRYLLDADHCIGHGYLLRAETNRDVVDVLARRVLPLLREYFYGNEHLLLLVLGDHAEAKYSIHRIDRMEETFEQVFGVPREDAIDAGYRPGRAEVTISVDPRFWDPNQLVPGPQDETYAVNAIRKIYEPPTAMTGPAAPAPAPAGEPPPDA